MGAEEVNNEVQVSGFRKWVNSGFSWTCEVLEGGWVTESGQG